MKRSIGFTILLAILVQVGAAQGLETSGLKPVFKNGLWGYADTRGRMVIAPQFDAAGEFENGLARVGMVDEERPEVNGTPNLKWGYIDGTGKVIVPLRYAALRPFVGDLAAAAIRLDGVNPSTLRTRGDDSLRWGYVNRKGEVQIALQYLGAGDFSEGLAAVNVTKLTTSEGEHESGLCEGPRNYGYIDTAGLVVIEPQYTMASAFKGGQAGVAKGSFEYMGRCLCCAPRFRGIHGFVDRAGKFTRDPRATDVGPESNRR
jgi:hypothetical protein